MFSMHNVDLRQLATLVAVVDEGTYARAAARVGFTQSAVSQQIASLEKSAKVVVFDRPKGPKPVELTAAGHLVVDYARVVLERATGLDAQLDRLRRGISGQLTIGAFQSVSSRLLPNIIGQMRSEVPAVEVRFTETDDQAQLLRGVVNDEMDMAFTFDHEPDPRISIDVLGHDPFVVIAPVDEATGPTVSLVELYSRPLIGQPHNNSWQLMIDERMRTAGLRPDYAYRLSDNSAVQSMVRSGIGWALVPALAIDTNDRLIAILEPDPPVAPRTIQLIRRTGRTLVPAADAFTRITHDVAAKTLAVPDHARTV